MAHNLGSSFAKSQKQVGERAEVSVAFLGFSTSDFHRLLVGWQDRVRLMTYSFRCKLEGDAIKLNKRECDAFLKMKIGAEVSQSTKYQHF